MQILRLTETLKKVHFRHFLFIIALVFFIGNAFAQNAADSSYNQKISAIENNILKIKNLPQEDQKPYYAILSDVENRKNTLKMLLKTPIEKRDKAWDESWSQNYSKAIAKLESVQPK